MKLTFKKTTIQTIEIDDISYGELEHLKEAIESGELTCADEVGDWCENCIDNGSSMHKEKQMSVQENDGEATIILYGDDKEIIATNKN